ncbi:hypothetical protein [Staphylococcus shinii]|uniref:hypothetical protein n=2 Tax=Staphylococcus shinii TaxID=2912228 RepID=UPI00298F0611|nr:hypothetical protein [Staphylococcus shinii]MDW8570478.1 hypothetical protein [Staphylococcus shinii]
MFTLIICIIFVVGCVLISNKYRLGNPLEMMLLSLGLFATFGGAYFGAKIAGQISRDNMIDELRINRDNELERMNIEYHLNQIRYLHEKTTILYFNMDKMDKFITEIIFDIFQDKVISEKNLDFIVTELEQITESIKVINNELIFLGIKETIDIGSENYIDVSRSIRRGIEFNKEYVREAFCNCIIEDEDGEVSFFNMYSFTGKEVSGTLMLLSEERQKLLNKLNVN